MYIVNLLYVMLKIASTCVTRGARERVSLYIRTIFCMYIRTHKYVLAWKQSRVSCTVPPCIQTVLQSLGYRTRHSRLLPLFKRRCASNIADSDNVTCVRTIIACAKNTTIPYGHNVRVVKLLGLCSSNNDNLLKMFA